MSDNESSSKIKKIVIAIVLLLVAGAVATYFLIPRPDTQNLAYFYDLGSEKLFTAASTLRAPIDAPSKKTIDGQGAGVLATVYSCGSCANPAEQKVVYIEKMSGEAKQAMDDEAKLAAKRGQEDIPSRAMRDLQTKLEEGQFIARPAAEPKWVKTASDEGIAIKSDIDKLCGGTPPVRCNP